MAHVLTEFQISATRDSVGRPPKNDHAKSMPLRFPPGLRERMDAVLREGENRTSFIQKLITAEVERREVEPPKAPTKPSKRG